MQSNGPANERDVWSHKMNKKKYIIYFQKSTATVNCYFTSYDLTFDNILMGVDTIRGERPER